MRRMFSRNQIVDMIQENGGTKLYKHDILLDENYFTIISTSKDSFKDRHIYAVLTGYDIIQFVDLNVDYCEILSINSDGDELYFIDNTGSIGHYSLSNTEIADDVITKL